MAKLYELTTYESDTGNLTVFEKIIPGVIQRVFYIYETGTGSRAGHRHHRTWNALICLRGSCRIYNNDGILEEVIRLETPRQCLVLEPKDWHSMDEFSEDAILLVVSNELYDKDDYIYEPYSNSQMAPGLSMAAS
ncbi:sugar 3,4-ketoisomerase [Spirosoma pulveris]